MAFTDREKQLIAAYFAAQAEKNKESLIWLVDFFLLPVEEQYAAMKSFFATAKDQLVTAKAGLEAEKAAHEVRIQTDIDTLDAIAAVIK